MATPEEQVIHYARIWCRTKRTAKYAAVGNKNKAKRARAVAEMNLLKAVWRLPGARDEIKSEDTDPS